MKSAEQSAGTRRRILEAARGLIHTHGYNEVGISAICEEADVVKGSFYHFFPSKQALLDVVIDENRQAVMAGLDQISRGFGNGRDKIMAQFQAVLDSARGQKSKSGRILGCTLGTVASELGAGNEKARAASAAAFREWQQNLEQLVRDGMADGSLAPSISPEDTAFGLLAVIQGMSTLGRSFDDPEMLQSIARTAVKRLLPARGHH